MTDAQATSEAVSTRGVVLHVRVVTGAGGGPDKTILNSPRFLQPLGYRSLCVYLHPEGDPDFDVVRKRAEQAEAKLIAVPDRGALDLRSAKQLLKICKEENVTIWHGHDYKSNALGLLLKNFHRMNLVTTVHGWVEQSSRLSLYYRIDKACLKRYERVICVSKDLQKECERVGVRSERIDTIANAIDEDHFQRTQSVEDAKQQLGFPADRPVIGAVGRLSPEKGFDLLIQAIHKLKSEGLDCQLVIAGEGKQRGELESLIDSLNLKEQVQLLGHRKDTLELYQAMDLFVLSSLREGLPNVVLEAMALETPVVATKVAGVPNLIQHDQNGILVEPENVDALAMAIRSVLVDRQKAREMAQAARRTIETEYSFRTRMEKVAAVYDQLRKSQP